MNETNLITVDVNLKGFDLLLSGTGKAVEDLSVADLHKQCIDSVQRLNLALSSEPDAVESLKYKLLDVCELFWRVYFLTEMQSKIASCVDSLYRKFLIVAKNRKESIDWNEYLDNTFNLRSEDGLNEAMRKLLIREALEDYALKYNWGWPCSI